MSGNVNNSIIVLYPHEATSSSSALGRLTNLRSLPCISKVSSFQRSVKEQITQKNLSNATSVTSKLLNFYQLNLMMSRLFLVSSDCHPPSSSSILISYHLITEDDFIMFSLTLHLVSFDTISKASFS